MLKETLAGSGQKLCVAFSAFVYATMRTFIFKNGCACVHRTDRSIYIHIRVYHAEKNKVVG